MTELRKKIDLLYGVTSVESLPDVIDEINSALTEFEDDIEINRLGFDDIIETLKKELDDAEERIEELEVNECTRVISSPASVEQIKWKASNLLDQQIMEALSECLSKGNKFHILNMLNAYAK